jgi:hypothetical protein
MRSVFPRAVLLGALAALAIATAKLARAETMVFVCTSASEASPLRVEVDIKQNTVAVEDVARATRDLYPLEDRDLRWIDAAVLQSRLGDKYRCRPAT